MDETTKDLTQSLLEQPTNNTNNTNHTGLFSIKAYAVAAGWLTTVLSQLLLEYCLWDETVLTENTSRTQVALFALYWSVWTFVLVFGGLNLCLQHLSSNAQQLQCFEIYYVVVSLLTICSMWIFTELMGDVCVAKLLVGTVLGLVVSLVSCAVVHLQTSEQLGSSSLIASTIGLVFGICSQFVLSLLLWTDVEMKTPVYHNVWVFSTVWSCLTVLMTLLGYFGLSCLIEKDPRVLLRSEAVYVASCLFGICIGWTVLDFQSGMTDQIFPSLVILALSLAALKIILYCFPENECLQEMEERKNVEANTTSDKDNTVLSVV